MNHTTLSPDIIQKIEPDDWKRLLPICLEEAAKDVSFEELQKEIENIAELARTQPIREIRQKMRNLSNHLYDYHLQLQRDPVSTRITRSIEALLTAEIFHCKPEMEEIEELSLAYENILFGPDLSPGGIRQICAHTLLKIYQEAIKQNPKKTNPRLGRALITPDIGRALLYPQRLGFPEPWMSFDRLVLDPKKPTIYIYGLNGNSLSRAREMDRQGGANVVIPITEVMNIETNKRELEWALVYREGKTWIIQPRKTIPPNYIVNRGHDNYGNNAATTGSERIERLLENKLLVLIELTRKGVATTLNHEPCTSGYVPYRKDGLSEAELQDLLSLMEEGGKDKFVIKPNSTSCGFGVRIIDIKKAPSREEISLEIAKQINTILKLEQPALIEPFITPYPLSIDGKNVDWNLRVLTTRDEKGTLIVDAIVVRYGEKDKPVNISLGAQVTTLTSLTGQIPNIQELEQDICKTAIRAVRVIERKARKKSDLYGVDIIVTQNENGYPKPVINEINGAYSGGLWAYEQALPAEDQGTPTRHFAKRVHQRATEHLESTRKKAPMD